LRNRGAEVRGMAAIKLVENHAPVQQPDPPWSESRETVTDDGVPG